jgi:type IV pilus assembly protein PilN
MIRVNLLPAQEVARAAGRRQELAAVALVLAVGGCFFVAAHGWQRARMAGAERQLRALRAELSALQGPYAEVTRIEQQKQELREKLRVIGQLEAKKAGPVRMLSDLSAATPDKLWLTEYAEVNGRLKLSGLGVDEQTVADFLRRLGAVPFFRRVDLDETSQVNQEGAKLKKFVISGQLDFGDGAAHARHQAGARPSEAAR